MPVRWRHRIVRVTNDEASISQTVLRVIEDGWIFVAGERTGEPGATDLVFRRACPDARQAAWG